MCAIPQYYKRKIIKPHKIRAFEKLQRKRINVNVYVCVLFNYVRYLVNIGIYNKYKIVIEVQGINNKLNKFTQYAIAI